MKVTHESFAFMKNLKILNLWSKTDNNWIGNPISKALFNNAKYQSNMEKLNLGCNKV